MSLSEIIKKRFKENIQIKKLTTADEINQYIIKAPETANDITENASQVQLQSRIQDIETDQTGSWTDMDFILRKLQDTTSNAISLA